jgi:hypothetical protein
MFYSLFHRRGTLRESAFSWLFWGKGRDLATVKVTSWIFVRWIGKRRALEQSGSAR